MSPTLRFALWLFPRRARASWKLIAASALGVILVTTLASAGAIYYRNIADAGLRYAIADAPSQAGLNLQLMVTDRPLGLEDYERVRRVVQESTQARLEQLAGEVHRIGIAPRFPFVERLDQVPPRFGAPRAYLFFQSGFRENARLVSGRWPQPFLGSPGEEAASIEALVGSQAAREIGWPEETPLFEETVLFLVPFGSSPQEKIPVTVVGIVEPAVPTDPYWFLDHSRFRLAGSEAEPVVPLYIDESTFFTGVGARYPMLLGTYWWNYFLNVEALSAAGAIRAQDSLEALDADINRSFPRSLLISGLSRVIASYHASFSLARMPMLLFVFLVASVVLYYLFLMAFILARAQADELALMRGRGTSVLQVGAVLGMGQGTLITAPSILLGPFLGLALALILPTGPAGLDGVSSGLYPFVFLVAFLAGLACWCVFTFVGTLSFNRAAVTGQRERPQPPAGTVAYRYAIDLLVLAALGLVWWQIRGRGGFLTESLSGDGLETDVSLLLGPALAMLAAGLVLIRFLPFILRALVRAADLLGPLWLVHGLKRAARDHVPYESLVILLMLTMALGVFAARFGATLTQSQADQARFAVGGDIVVPSIVSGFNRIDEEALKSVPGIGNVMAVDRDTVITGRGSSKGAKYSLLAVDPAVFPRVSWFREDFAAKDLNELLSPLRRSEVPRQGILLPEGTGEIGLWMRSERPHYGYNVRARLRDASGEYHSVKLGSLGISSWTYLEAPLGDDLLGQSPVTLVGLYLTGGLFLGEGQGSVAIDEVTAVVMGDHVVVEGFESQEQWALLPNLGLVRDSIKYESSSAHSGTLGLTFSWTEPIVESPRGLFLSSRPILIPAIGGPGLHAGQELIGHIAGDTVGFQVKEVADYFPTVYPTSGRSLVVDLAHLNGYLSMLPLARPHEPTEFWLGLDDSVGRDQVMTDLEEVYASPLAIRDREQRVRHAVSNPLVGSAWNGLSLLASVALGGAAVIGFGIYAVSTVQRAKQELSVFHALGLPLRRLGTLLVLEDLLITVLALGVGTVVGLMTGGWMADFLSVTPVGTLVVPPLEMALNGGLVTLAWAAVVLAAIAATLLVLVLSSRLRFREVLRTDK